MPKTFYNEYAVAEVTLGSHSHAVLHQKVWYNEVLCNKWSLAWYLDIFSRTFPLLFKLYHFPMYPEMTVMSPTSI